MLYSILDPPRFLLVLSLAILPRRILFFTFCQPNLLQPYCVSPILQWRHRYAISFVIITRVYHSSLVFTHYQNGFQVLPKRWIVERTFAWLVHQRRLARDYERLSETSESFIYVAMIRLMLRRLAAEWLFRHFLTKIGKDKPVLPDLDVIKDSLWISNQREDAFYTGNTDRPIGNHWAGNFDPGIWSYFII